jgi:hypothetical protein
VDHAVVLDLSLSSHSSDNELTRARIVVYGVPRTARVLPANDDKGLLPETFDIWPGAADDLSDSAALSRELRLLKISYITRVEVTQVDYADGHVWRASPADNCKALPSSAQAAAAH